MGSVGSVGSVGRGGGQRSEVRGQRSEVRGQPTANSQQLTANHYNFPSLPPAGKMKSQGGIFAFIVN